MVSRAQQRVIPQVPTPSSSPHRRPRPQQRPVYRKMTALLLIVFIGGTIAYLAVRNTTVYVQNAAVQSMETELRMLQNKNERMRQEVTQLQSPKTMIQTAMKLGLLLPTIASQQPVPASASDASVEARRVANTNVIKPNLARKGQTSKASANEKVSERHD